MTMPRGGGGGATLENIYRCMTHVANSKLEGELPALAHSFSVNLAKGSFSAMRDSRRCARSSSQGAREGPRQAIELLAELADRLSEFHACCLCVPVTHFRSEFHVEILATVGYSDCLKLGDGTGSLLFDGVRYEKRELFRVEDMMVSYHICLR